MLIVASYFKIFIIIDQKFKRKEKVQYIGVPSVDKHTVEVRFLLTKTNYMLHSGCSATSAQIWRPAVSQRK